MAVGSLPLAVGGMRGGRRCGASVLRKSVPGPRNTMRFIWAMCGGHGSDLLPAIVSTLRRLLGLFLCRPRWEARRERGK